MIRTFKNADGEKLVAGQLKIQEREGLKDEMKSARGWEVVEFRVSLLEGSTFPLRWGQEGKGRRS